MKIGSTQVAKFQTTEYYIPLKATKLDYNNFKIESPITAEKAYDSSYYFPSPSDDTRYVWNGYQNYHYDNGDKFSIVGMTRMFDNMENWISSFKRDKTLIRKVKEIEDYREHYSMGFKVIKFGEELSPYSYMYIKLYDKFKERFGRDMKEGDEIIMNFNYFSNLYHPFKLPITAFKNINIDYSIIKDIEWLDTNLKEELLKEMPSIINMQELPELQMSSIS